MPPQKRPGIRANINNALRMARRAAALARAGQRIHGMARNAGKVRKTLRGRPNRMLAAFESRNAKRRMKRAKKIAELNNNPEAQALFKEFDIAMREVFGRQYKAVMRSMPAETLNEIKVMLWNGQFEPAEIRGFVEYLKEEGRHKPRRASIPAFFREAVREIVTLRQEEYKETGSIETVFYPRRLSA